MQLSLGMDLGRGLNLNSWQYGGEGPSVSQVLEAMDCHVSSTGSQSAMLQDSQPGSNAEVHCCSSALHDTLWLTVPAGQPNDLTEPLLDPLYNSPAEHHCHWNTASVPAHRALDVWAVLLQAEKCQVAQLTSAMIPQPATAFARAPPAPEAERCGSANLMVCHRTLVLAVL